MEKPFVLVGLSPALGRVITMDRLQPGEVNRAGSYLEVAAGKATNTARVLRELGQRVILVSPLGDENHAHFRSLAAVDNVEMDPVLYPGRVRWALTLVDDNSSTEIVVGEPEPIPGDIAPLIVERVRSHLPGAPACVVAGSRPPNIPVSVIAAIAGAARDAGVPLFLDIRGEDLLEALAAGKGAPVVVKINEEEYRETVARAGLPGPGCELRVPEDLSPFVERFSCTLVITRGSAPVLFADSMGRSGMVPIPPVKARNPIGSGDTALATLALRFVQGIALPKAVEEAVQRASRNAEFLKPGTTTGP
ncbi:MAG: carbohydrate kinase [Spirochaetaceae bacterium]|nr:MAG: carbohydrate kinase [Spirochaetaceae bacterium]